MRSEASAKSGDQNSVCVRCHDEWSRNLADSHGLADDKNGDKMIQFNDWCIEVEEEVKEHLLKVLTGNSDKLDVAIESTANIVSSHYATEEHIARALTRLGKTAAADLIQRKLPTTKGMRSGDIGEILATEWITAHSGGYQTPIKRLRWKDHRNMAMRGDDVIGILQIPETGRLCFLKTEAKSRIQLTTQVLDDARAALDRDEGRPSAHALSFISERLLELGNTPLADAIDDALLKHGIPTSSVIHLLFVFSGNAPNALLAASLNAYVGGIKQWGVGLHINEHAAFVDAIYDRVIANALNN